jgi:hypothetical protein
MIQIDKKYGSISFADQSKTLIKNNGEKCPFIDNAACSKCIVYVYLLGYGCNKNIRVKIAKEYIYELRKIKLERILNNTIK